MDPRTWATDVLDRARRAVEQLPEDDLVHVAAALQDLDRLVRLPGLAVTSAPAARPS